MSHPELSWQVVKEGGWASHSKLRAALNQESAIATLAVRLSCSVAPGAEEILNQECRLVSTTISLAVPIASPEQGTDGVVD